MLSPPTDQEDHLPSFSSSSSANCLNLAMFTSDLQPKRRPRKKHPPPTSPHTSPLPASAASAREEEITRPHSLSDYVLLKALGNGNMGTVFLGLLQHRHVYASSTMDSVESTHHGLFALKIMSKEEMWKKGMSKRAAMEKEVLTACTRSLPRPSTPLHDRTGHVVQQQQQQRLFTSSAQTLSIDEHVSISPFLPCLHAHFSTESYEVLVLDYCAGGDLNALRRSQPGFRFSEDHARFYAAEIVVALEELQARGYVYRDLKPENVMVKATGHVMLADFDLCTRIGGQGYDKRIGDGGGGGSSKKKKAQAMWAEWAAKGLKALASSGGGGGGRSTGRERVAPVAAAAAREGGSVGGGGGSVGGGRRRAASLVGTEEYVAPEVVWGEAGVGVAVDWWALGVLLFELLAGFTPFKGSTRRETFFNILCRDPPFHLLPSETSTSPQLLDLLSKLLHKKPHLRLSSAHDIKSHPFFASRIHWPSLSYSPPPFLPPPSKFAVQPTPPSLLLSHHISLSQQQRLLASTPPHIPLF